MDQFQRDKSKGRQYQCPQCGYDLRSQVQEQVARGLTKSCCPECGLIVDMNYWVLKSSVSRSHEMRHPLLHQLILIFLLTPILANLIVLILLCSGAFSWQIAFAVGGLIVVGVCAACACSRLNRLRQSGQWYGSVGCWVGLISYFLLVSMGSLLLTVGEAMLIVVGGCAFLLRGL